MPSNLRLTRLLATSLLSLCLLPALPVSAQAPLAPLGPPPVPAANPQTPAKIALGQTLFWDEQLSLTGTVACGTCHAPTAGGSDPRLPAASAASTHPGPDGEFDTADDVIGALGVPLHDADGLYLASASFGMRPQVGSRQSISAINAAYPPVLFWDGRATGSFVDPDTQQTLITVGGALENQALGPLVNSSEMAHAGGTLANMQARIADAIPLALSPEVPAALADWVDGRSYPALFAEVFGDGTISAARIALAIASYERTLVTNQTPLDAQLSGTPSLTALEMQGRQVYNQVGCQRCHGGALLSDNIFHYTGVGGPAAPPRPPPRAGGAAPRGRMRTPGLRNIELTAPYMADGRFATLEQVIDFYARGGDFTAGNLAPQMTPFAITAAQRTALAAFLRRPLTDPRLLTQSGPFARPRLYGESAQVPAPIGQGVPGQGGLTPRLIAIEPPLAGVASFTVAIEQAAPGATARLLLDLVEPSGPDAASLQQREFTISAQGNASLNLALPDDPLLAGQPLFLRVFISDQAAPGGWSATGSVRFSLLGTDTRVFGNGFEP
jgi:cytochrome c peroxidase